MKYSVSKYYVSLTKILIICLALALIPFSCSLFGSIEDIEKKLLETESDPFTSVQGTSLLDKLAWLEDNARSGGKYGITVDDEEVISGIILSYEGRNKISVRLRGIDGVEPITLSNKEAMFTVESGVTLILDKNITLKGIIDNEDSMIVVNSGAALIMNKGSKITGNYNRGDEPFGGGVYVNGGAFTMNDGEISDNRASYGGGVYLNGGTFTMNNGSITGNYLPGSFRPNGDGGGVYVYQGSFLLNDGKMSDNRAGAYSGSGGGVYLEESTFIMKGGVLSGNKAGDGSGSACGGGVCVYDSVFIMSGGVISGGYSGRGGGVYVEGFFSKTGGTIYGDMGLDPDSNQSGDYDFASGAVNAHFFDYDYNEIYLARNTTAGPGVNLSFDSTVAPTVYSGGWDMNVPGDDIQQKFNWLNNNAVTGGSYIVTLNDYDYDEEYYKYSDEDLYKHDFGNRTLSYAGKKDISITLNRGGNHSYRSIIEPDTGESIFIVGSGVTLVLDGVTLNGTGGERFSGSPVVWVRSGGTLIMAGYNTEIKSNNSKNTSGGGVYVDGGTFIMGCGVIKGNSTSMYGGGVYVTNGFFRKTEGTIYGYIEDDPDSNSSVANGQGHAVYAARGSTVKYRDTTSEWDDDVLWFDGTKSPAIFGGNWDN